MYKDMGLTAGQTAASVGGLDTSCLSHCDMVPTLLSSQSESVRVQDEIRNSVTRWAKGKVLN